MPIAHTLHHQIPSLGGGVPCVTVKAINATDQHAVPTITAGIAVSSAELRRGVILASRMHYLAVRDSGGLISGARSKRLPRLKAWTLAPVASSRSLC